MERRVDVCIVCLTRRNRRVAEIRGTAYESGPADRVTFFGSGGLVFIVKDLR